MKIYKRLGAIQKAVSTPRALFGLFGGTGSGYHTSSQLISIVKPLLTEEEAVTVDYCITDKCGKVYIEATATFRCGQETVSCKGYAREAESKVCVDEPQLTGNASAHAMKHALEGLFCIGGNRGIK